jgi:regulator of extracellular matrix RemA (YlzA/DUF370 family)
MDIQLLNIGFNTIISAQDIIAVVSPDSAPIRRLIDESRSQGASIDATQGRPIRSVVFTPPSTMLRGFRQNSNGAKSNVETVEKTVEQSTQSQVKSQLILSAIEPETITNRFLLKHLGASFQTCSLSPNFMDIKLINIGFGNIVLANRVVAIVSPESAPIKRIITDARERGQLVDATYGRRTRAVIVTDVGHIILSAIQPETVANRLISSKDD